MKSSRGTSRQRPVPLLSVEVDNLEEVQQRNKEVGSEPEYGPADELWGFRRFYVRDPFERLINDLSLSRPA